MRQRDIRINHCTVRLEAMTGLSIFASEGGVAALVAETSVAPSEPYISELADALAPRKEGIRCRKPSYPSRYRNASTNALNAGEW